MIKDKVVTHCWEDGPETEDGCSTTCMLLAGHGGPHEWSRDDEIGISFKSAPASEDYYDAVDAVEMDVDKKT